MPKSSRSLRASLSRLHQERRQLLRVLTKAGPLAVGTVSVVRRKCGKASCHCADGLGHPQTLYLFTDEDGQRRCRLVRRDDEKEFLRAGTRYREFRHALRRLRTVNQEEERLLVALMRSKAVSYK